VWWPSPWASRSLDELAIGAICGFWAVVGVWFAASAISHLRRTHGLDRVAMIPLVAGFCAVGLTSGFSSSMQPYPTVHQNLFFFILSVMLLAVPLGLGISAYRTSLQRAVLTERIAR
jgi:hypothetical protein